MAKEAGAGRYGISEPGRFRGCPVMVTLWDVDRAPHPPPVDPDHVITQDVTVTFEDESCLEGTISHDPDSGFRQIIVTAEPAPPDLRDGEAQRQLLSFLSDGLGWEVRDAEAPSPGEE
jgi:hypothetical protein